MTALYRNADQRVLCWYDGELWKVWKYREVTTSSDDFDPQNPGWPPMFAEGFLWLHDAALYSEKNSVVIGTLSRYHDWDDSGLKACKPANISPGCHKAMKLKIGGKCAKVSKRRVMRRK